MIFGFYVFRRNIFPTFFSLVYVCMLYTIQYTHGFSGNKFILNVYTYTAKLYIEENIFLFYHDDGDTNLGIIYHVRFSVSTYIIYYSPLFSEQVNCIKHNK